MTIVGIVLMALGFLGCFVNKIPGPLVAFIGLLFVKFAAGLDISFGIIGLCAALVVISMIINAKLVPSLVAKLHPYGKGGSWGAFLGSLIGLIVMMSSESVVAGVIIMVALPYVFAWLFELISTKSIKECSKRAASALVVFLVSTVIKLAVVALCMKVTFEEM